MGAIRVVNIVPNSLSGETIQDSEPNIAVNPQRPTDIVATAFTPAPMGGSFAPIYVSNGRRGTRGRSGTSCRATARSGRWTSPSRFAPTGGIALRRRTERLERRPADADPAHDEFHVHDADDGAPPADRAGSALDCHVARRSLVRRRQQPAGSFFSAFVDVGLNVSASCAADSWARSSSGRQTAGQDGPPVRVAAHPDGTIYAALPALVEDSRLQRQLRHRRRARRRVCRRHRQVLRAHRRGRREGRPARRHRSLHVLQRHDGSGAHRRRSRARGRSERLGDRLDRVVRAPRRGRRHRLDAAGARARPTGAAAGRRSCARSPTPRTRRWRSMPTGCSASPTSSSTARSGSRRSS